MSYYLRKSSKSGKKWSVTNPSGKTVHFGATGYEDFTSHKDEGRKKNYLSRHGGGNQKWGKSGLATAGFWSRWLLWNKKSISASISDIKRRFGIKIIRGQPPIKGRSSSHSRSSSRGRSSSRSRSSSRRKKKCGKGKRKYVDNATNRRLNRVGKCY